MDFLVCDAPLPDEVVTHTIDDERRTTWLREALSVLNERELKIIESRRLVDDGATWNRSASASGYRRNGSARSRIALSRS